MTRWAFGLCSGSLPRASAAELADATTSAGGSTVDLRIGKGHAWEAGGIDVFTARGVDVAFVGIGWRLGVPGDPLPAVPVTGYPVKVFCAPAPDPALVAEQVRDARERGITLWAETHRGGPDAALLAELAEQCGLGIVADSLGLAETGGTDPGVLARLAQHTHAVQVKGFTATGDGYRHRPLCTEDLAPLWSLRDAGAPVRAVTVETRAGSEVADLALLLTEFAVTPERMP